MLPSTEGQEIHPIARAFYRFEENMSRTGRILEVQKSFGVHQKPEFADYLSDILRSTVVFYHASLEELVREIVISRSAHLSHEDLNDIPLTVPSSEERPTRFGLGRLKHFRGDSIEEVIHSSVTSHVSGLSFGKTGKIYSFLEAVKIDTTALKPHAGHLARMIKRRHQIVHHADLSGEDGSKPVPLGMPVVASWLVVLNSFVLTLVLTAAPEEVKIAIAKEVDVEDVVNFQAKLEQFKKILEG
ncbi:hypothetical protein JYT83_00305 [bacterium AH-315-F18]|nr:hypothetical protein [bacterium AH-315-F18]